MTFEPNPRAIVGSNEAPDYATQVTEAMRREYGEVEKTVAGLLEEARVLPAEITNDEEKGRVTAMIKRLRDLTKRIEAFHSKESEPYLRGKQAVDQFWFALWDKCVRRNKANRPGAADILGARLTDYDTRKLAEEQARRRREAEEAARVARVAAEERARQERAAEEARLAAERARAPAKVEEKGAIATAAEIAADTARVNATVAEVTATDTHIATLAKPADIMRHRDVETGTLSTMATEAYAEVENADLLDKDKLWPFIKLEAKEQALRAWAKTVSHNQQMAGARIGKRPRSVVR